jgi:hypothetical protein
MIQCFLIEPVFGDKLKEHGITRARDIWEDREIVSWVRPGTDEQQEFAHQFGPGALYYAVWLPRNITWGNEEGPHLYVQTPGGDWDIDSRCSNCTLPEDRVHRCWVRHGMPPQITVDKSGLTCGAGAGSIQQRTWHGHLHNGLLVQV